MKRLITILTTIFIATVALADIQVTTSVKNGDKIAGVVELRATVIAGEVVNQVEFYVNGNLRETDRSTPYRYQLDTIPEREGPLEVEIAVFTADGNNKRVKMTLIVDNGVGQGAAFHTENAVRFLNVAKWDEAIQAARVALKADEEHIGAKLAMARAYLGKNEYDNAQKWAEDAVISTDTIEGADLLAGIHVERAFRIISMSGERGDAMRDIANAFKAAVAQRTSALAMRLAALGPVTDENRLAVVDLLIQRHDYSAARRHLLDKFDEVNPDLAIGNRLVYATLRSGRMAEAYRLADQMRKRNTMDATTWALLAAGHGNFRHWEEAAAAIRNGGFDDPDAPSLMSVSAYVAILRNDQAATRSQIERMLSLNISDPQVYHYLSVLQFFSGQYVESSDSFRRTIVREPLLLDAYVERGYQALLNATSLPAGLEKDQPVLLEQAKAFFEVAQSIKPDSPEALNGLALTHLYLKNYPEALRMANAAVGAGPEFAWPYFTLAAAENLSGDVRAAQRSTDRAGEMDKLVLSGRGVPSPGEAWLYTWRYGRQAVLIAPK